MKALLYCNKNLPYVFGSKQVQGPYQIFYNWQKMKRHVPSTLKSTISSNVINGKIVAECDFDIDYVFYISYSYPFEDDGEYETSHNWDLRKCNLKDDYEIFEYLTNDGTIDEPICSYAIRFSNIEIFDTPEKLSSYYKENYADIYGYYEHMSIARSQGLGCGTIYPSEPEEKDYVLTKAPNNMKFVYNDIGDKYLLIPINPKDLCGILNNKIDTIIKKRVLKEMLKNE